MFKKIISAITGFFSKEKPELEAATEKALLITNVLKSFFGSATGKSIESIVEAIFPTYGNIIVTALNAYFGAYSTNLDAASGINAISTMPAGDAKTLAIGNIAAVVGKAIADQNGSGGSSIQKSAVLAHLAYNPQLLDDIEEPENENKSALPVEVLSPIAQPVMSINDEAISSLAQNINATEETPG